MKLGNGVCVRIPGGVPPKGKGADGVWEGEGKKFIRAEIVLERAKTDQYLRALLGEKEKGGAQKSHATYKGTTGGAGNCKRHFLRIGGLGGNGNTGKRKAGLPGGDCGR